MILIVITGPPATGKTEIAARVKAATGYPILSKDEIKEALFDERGIGDRLWSRQLGIESYEILWQRADAMFAAGQSFIIEGNFSGATAEKIRTRANELGYEIRQISCDAPDEIIIQRIRERWDSGRRHRGHQDHIVLAELERGRSWGAERAFVFGTSILRLDQSNTLEQNNDAAVRFTTAP